MDKEVLIDPVLSLSLSLASLCNLVTGGITAWQVQLLPFACLNGNSFNIIIYYCL